MEFSHKKCYAQGPVNHTSIRLTMHALLEERVEKHPDREMHVFVSDNERLTYAEFKGKVVDLAAGFLNLGLRRGDCVAVMGANHMEWPLINGAARAIGVATVSLLIGHTPEILGAMIKKTSCKALFITRSPEKLYSDVCKMIPELSSSTPGNLKANNFPSLKCVIATGVNHQRGTIHLDDIYIAGCEENVNEAARKVNMNDISYMCMTSGTTAPPKLVHISHFRELNTAYALERLVDENQATKFVSCANLAYTDGTVLSQTCPLLFGSTCVYPSPTYSFEKFLQAVQDESATHFFCVIHWLTDLTFSPITDQYDLSSLRGGMVTGSPIPPVIPFHLKKKFNIDILNAYGSTEALDVSCVLVEEGLKSCTTVGRPLRNVEIQIVDTSGLPVNFGEEGEVCIRNSVAFFEGYYADIEKTKKAVTEDGWLRMGDVGKLDEDGYLTLIGRTKDVIIRRATNVYPFELETLLLSHPAVKNVQVVGIPDYRIGQDICACLILKDGHTFTTEDMKEYCVNKCFINSLPTYCLEFKSFPQGVTGKIDRKKLSEMASGRITIPVIPH